MAKKLSNNWKALQKRLKSATAPAEHAPSGEKPANGAALETKSDLRVLTPTPKKKSNVLSTTKNETASKVTKKSTVLRKKSKKPAAAAAVGKPCNGSTSTRKATKPSTKVAVLPTTPKAVSSLHQQLLELDPKTPKGAGALARPGGYIALDCEFVGSRLPGPGAKEESVLARVSIVNYYGAVLMDTFVRPQRHQRITDFRTWVSGVTARDVLYNSDAVEFGDAVKKVAKLLEGRVLVGHALCNDLGVLKLGHPRSRMRDTAQHLPFKTRLGVKGGHSPSLKRLSKELLGVDIQSGQHSSVEDARAAMLLYRKYKAEFD